MFYWEDLSFLLFLCIFLVFINYMYFFINYENLILLVFIICFNNVVKYKYVLKKGFVF